MIRLTYSSEIENRHNEYFKTSILPKLRTLQIKPFQFDPVLDQSFLNQISFRGDGDAFNESLKEEQWGLYNLVENKVDLFSKGSPTLLRGLQDEITSSFPWTVKLLEPEHRDIANSFSTYLYELFQYENFKTKSLYHYYRAKALHNTSENKYSENVKVEIIRLLIDDFPEIEKFRNKLEADENKKAKAFERIFNKLTGVSFTLKGFNSLTVFNHEWNDYSLIMDGKITVCPYCNRQYITPFLSNSGRVRADIDHFYSKKRYPYFSMSLYNLIPSCKQCNQSLKGEKQFPFDGLHPFEHSLHDYFRFKAIKSYSQDNIEIALETVNHQPKNIKDYLEIFKLGPLYSYHDNHAKELVKKRKIYNENYLEDLLENDFAGIKKSFRDIDDLKGFIVGYTVDLNLLGKEPLAKLRRDLAIQLGFLDIHASNFDSIDEDLIDALQKLVD
ncbi:hypothetical protein [Exiguobacterium profundum]|uniref:hypothetical protein n=1 Tax=Exiguobacterium profundum TaxID=307643 RepID=UPI00093F963F|nr:hypothetical protein [Exiguobacterium profundum]